MRVLLLAVMASVVGGCTFTIDGTEMSWDPDNGIRFPNRPDQNQDANGPYTRVQGRHISSLAFLDDSRVAAGIGTNTCNMRTRTGEVRKDYDVGRGKDQVYDCGSDTNPDEVLVGVNAIPNWGPDEPVTVIKRVIDAKFVDGGFISLSQDCAVNWSTQSGDASVSLGPPDCGAADFSVDPIRGEAWVADRQILHVTPDGYEIIDAGDLVAYDPVTDLVYAAIAGDSVLRGYTRDGIESWALDLGRPINAVAAQGLRGNALAHVEPGDVVAVDGVSGQLVFDIMVQEVAADVQASPSGDVLAVDDGWRVAFYHLDI